MHVDGHKITAENIAASFQKAAIDMLLRRLYKASKDTGLKKIVTGGGVAANSYLRSCLESNKEVSVYSPSLKLCGDNGAMIAGLGYHYLANKSFSDNSLTVNSRVSEFRKSYP